YPSLRGRRFPRRFHRLNLWLLAYRKSAGIGGVCGNNRIKTGKNQWNRGKSGKSAFFSTGLPPNAVNSPILACAFATRSAPVAKAKAMWEREFGEMALFPRGGLNLAIFRVSRRLQIRFAIAPEDSPTPGGGGFVDIGVGSAHFPVHQLSVFTGHLPMRGDVHAAFLDVIDVVLGIGELDAQLHLRMIGVVGLDVGTIPEIGT